MRIPDELLASAYADRITCAIAAVRAAGAALVELRGTIAGKESAGEQLKTSTDLAAEGWVLGFLHGSFAGERFLAEEQFEARGEPWTATDHYWTVDALDGTRSYVEGFDGFCVQIAYVADGEPVVGVIGEPVTGNVYAGARGAGAWRIARTATTRLTGARARTKQPGLRLVDSTRPGGPVGALFSAVQGEFVECGSVGLKIVRVVEDRADFYAKRFNYKLWDVAPGEVLLREVGGTLGSWAGETIDYRGSRTHFTDVLAASSELYRELVPSLSG